MMFDVKWLYMPQIMYKFQVCVEPWFYQAYLQIPKIGYEGNTE